LCCSVSPLSPPRGGRGGGGPEKAQISFDKMINYQLFN
jgi:hypothetical protein